MLVYRYQNRTRCVVAQFRMAKLAVLDSWPSRFCVWRAFDLIGVVSDGVGHQSDTYFAV